MSSVARDTTTSKYRLGILVAVLAGEIFSCQTRGAHLDKNGFNVEKNT
jgi:hypothetical protein